MDKILIIGGNSTFISSIKAGLDSIALFEVVVAADDLAAVEILLTEKISLVLIDIKTPEVDCLETIAHMTRAHPSIPLVLMTDYGKPWFKHKQGRSDALYHLPKPFEIGVLVSAIFVGLTLKGEGAVRSGLTVKSLLPLVEVQKKTCRMEVKAQTGVKGFLYFREGVLVDAHFEGLGGEAAAREICRWDSITLHLADLPPRRISNRVETGLMELAGATWAKEAPAGPLSFDADPDGGNAFAPDSALACEKAAAGIIEESAADFLDIRGFAGLVASDREGRTLGRIRPREGIGLERLAGDLQTILTQIAESLHRCDLGPMSTLTVEAPAGTVFATRSGGPSADDCRLTGLTAADADRASMQTRMEALLHRILAARD